MAASKKNGGDNSPARELENVVCRAVDLMKKAKKHRKNLAGDNYYGNKLVALRSDATNALRRLSSQSSEDTSVLADFIEKIFCAETTASIRLELHRELSHSLKTQWQDTKLHSASASGVDFFPQTILDKTKKASVIAIGRQINGCFDHAWYDACAVMMRRLLETSIIEACEHKGIADKIKDTDGNYFQLSKLIDIVIANTKLSLSRNSKQNLPKLRDVGHLSAHSRYFHASKSDLEKIQGGCRIALEEMLHHAALL
jgi:hypothetical protein